MPTKADYAKIAIACKELGIERLEILEDRYQVTSMKDLTNRQLADLYRHFAALGWKPVTKKKREDWNKNRPDYIHMNGPAARQQRKILALWKDLGYEMAAIHTRVKKQFGIERLEWLLDYKSLHILITDLETRRQKSEIRRQR